MTKLQRLYNEQGQSPWLDNLTRVYLRDGRVSAAMNSTNLKVGKATERLIRSGAVVDRGALMDPDVQLEALVPVPVST